MVWNASTPIKLKTDWQYTEPINTGVFFRVNHTKAPLGSYYAVAQCELQDNQFLLLDEPKYFVIDKACIDLIKFVKPAAFTNRRIAIKRLAPQPSLKNQIKDLILPGFLLPQDTEVIYHAPSEWQVSIEVSDAIEPSATVNFAPIQNKLDEISSKLDTLHISGGGSATSLSDPYYAQTVLVCNFDQALTDAKGHQIIKYGDVAVTPDGATFDGNADYLQLEDSPDWDFEAGDFTIEFFANPAVDRATLGRDAVLAGTTVFNSSGWQFEVNSNTLAGVKGLSFLANQYQNRVYTPDGESAGRLRHYVIARSNGTLYILLDGVLKSNIANYAHFINNNEPLIIGGAGINWDSTYYFKGIIKAVRITKAVARYTKDYSIPTLPFPTK